MAWIIGDVHGCIKTLESLLSKLPKNEKVIFVGDLIDRGPGSKDVIQLIKEKNYDCIRGNHEDAMIDEILGFLDDPLLAKNSFWINKCGGFKTLESYNESTKIQINLDVKWLESLPYYKEYKDIKNKDGRYLVVSHSSIGNYWHMKDFPKNSDEYLTFIKNISTNRDRTIKDIPEIFNVFGHTPKSESVIKKHYADVDTGACYTKFKDLGNLSALEFPSMKVITQKNID